MLKRYETRGMMEWHPLLRAGKSTVRIPFTGGHLSGYGTTAATFETRDKVVQTIIEKSEYFRSGRIRLSCTIPESDDNKVHDKGVPTRLKNIKAFNNIEDAAEWLAMEKGIPSSRLLTREQCLEEGRRHGIDIRISDRSSPTGTSGKGVGK